MQNAELTEKKRDIIKHKNLLSNIKRGKKVLTFGDIDIEKKNFYCHTGPIFLNDLDIEKLLVSNKISFGEKNYKYFIGYLHNNNKVKPLHIMLSKTSGYVKRYEVQTKWMYFLIGGDSLLRKYNTTWNKVSADIKKEFDNKTVYKKKII